MEVKSAQRPLLEGIEFRFVLVKGTAGPGSFSVMPYDEYLRVKGEGYLTPLKGKIWWTGADSFLSLRAIPENTSVEWVREQGDKLAEIKLKIEDAALAELKHRHIRAGGVAASFKKNLTDLIHKKNRILWAVGNVTEYQSRTSYAFTLPRSPYDHFFGDRGCHNGTGSCS